MRDYLTVSASSLNSFFRCSQMYKWQFLDEKKPDEVFIFTAFGYTLHKALELHFKYGLSFEEIKCSWKSLLITAFSDAKGLEFPTDKILESCFNKGYIQIDNVEKMKKRWESYEIVEIEKYCKIPFENKFIKNVFLSGRIDMILKGMYLVCLDWKSSKSKEKDIDSNIQLTFYTYFVNILYGFSLDLIQGALAYPIDGDILFTQRTNEDFKNLFGQVNIMLERISKGDFVKEPKLNWKPEDCFFCQYKKTCEKE